MRNAGDAMNRRSQRGAKTSVSKECKGEYREEREECDAWVFLVLEIRCPSPHLPPDFRASPPPTAGI